MVIKVLAIGDVGNLMKSLSKITKRSEIYIVNFPKDGSGVFTHDDSVNRFSSWKVKNQVKYINKIKDNFDICITMGTGERIAYLADLNYIVYYVGRDIDAPRFVKNSKDDWYTEPLHQLNFLERKFYRKAFEFAIAHVAPTWVYEHLKKYTDSGIKMDSKSIDVSFFRKDSEPLEMKKNKFTFFSPQRISISKGTHLLWKALSLCKSDFEVIQVDWRDITTKEEESTSRKLRENLPNQVKLIPMIKRNDMPRYYKWADAIIANVIIGSFENVELEAVHCKKPVISWANKSIEIIIDNQRVESPFLPNSNKPEIIAEIIDKLVESKEFRENLLKREIEFVNKITDEEKIAEWWDLFFEKMVVAHKSIQKNSSAYSMIMRGILFYIGNRLYFKKIINWVISKK